MLLEQLNLQVLMIIKQFGIPCLISGGLAGLAGFFEASGPAGQLTPGLPQFYGFTAIIVAFLARLHPVGILFSALLIALSYVGGEEVQIEYNLTELNHSNFSRYAAFLFSSMRHIN